MTNQRYSQYFIQDLKGELFRPEEIYDPVSLRGKDHLNNKNFFSVWTCIDHACIMDDQPMKHDFDELICFIGGNIKNMFDFGAEVEFFMGEEMEKYTFNKTTIIYVPKGMIHCPLIFKKVERPILLQAILFAPEYTQEIIPGHSIS